MNRPSPTPHVFRRKLDAFVALPDRLRMPLAILAALFFHAIALVLIWVWPYVLRFLLSISLLPPSCAPRSAATNPTPKPTPVPLEIVLEPPKPEPEPEKEKEKLTPAEEQKLEQLFAAMPIEEQREYIDVEGLASKKNLSKRALLESWRDSVAGSRKQGTGSEPLPSQDGRNLPFTAFQNQRAVVGDPKKLQTPDEPPDKPKPLVVPGIDPGPIFTPLPTTVSQPDPKHPEKIAETAMATPPPPPPVPEPEPVTAPTPQPKPEPLVDLKKVVEAKEDEIPLFVLGNTLPTKPPDPAPEPVADAKPAPQPQPKAPPIAEVKPVPTPSPVAPHPTPVPLATPPPKTVAKQPTPAPRRENLIVASKTPQAPRPVPLPDPGYTPHQEKRKIDGGNAPGDDGVDAVATERGRYRKTLNRIVGSRWTYYVTDSQQASLITVGQVTLEYALDSKGKIVRLKVAENTSNSAHAALCKRVFLESQNDLEPPPPDLLRNGVFEDTFSFNLY